LVNDPFFSTCAEAGRKNTSVSQSGWSRQNDAVSTSTRSRTTSQLSFPSALRHRLPFAAPMTGFSPMTKYPSTSPSSMRRSAS